MNIFSYFVTWARMLSARQYQNQKKVLHCWSFASSLLPYPGPWMIIFRATWNFQENLVLFDKFLRNISEHPRLKPESSGLSQTAISTKNRFKYEVLICKLLAKLRPSFRKLKVVQEKLHDKQFCNNSFTDIY